MDQPVCLLLGPAPTARPGWISISRNALQAPDLVWSPRTLPMVESGTIDAIEVPCLLDTLTQDEALAALEEWRRALKTGGTLRLALTDLSACAAVLAGGPDARVRELVLRALYGASRGGLAHRWGWTPETLRADLGEAGFAEIQIDAAAPSPRPQQPEEFLMQARSRRPGRTDNNPSRSLRGGTAAAASAPRCSPDPSPAPSGPESFLGSGALLSLIDENTVSRTRIP